MTAIETESGVLQKAFDVLATFSPARDALSLSDIARRSGLPKTTTHRVLQQMLAVGVVNREGNRYHVGQRMFVLSSPSREAAVRDAALGDLSELHRTCGNTVHLAVLSEANALYLEKLDSRATVASPSLSGGRVPAHCTAVGKALLAYRPAREIEAVCASELVARTTASISSAAVLRRTLAQVRQDGFATDDEEAAPDLRCVAVPILVGGHAVAAISIAHAASRPLPPGSTSLLRHTAGRIGRKLTGVIQTNPSTAGLGASA